MYKILIIKHKVEGMHRIVENDWIKYVLPAPSREKFQTVWKGSELCSIHNRIAGLLLCYAYNDDFLKADERKKLTALYSDKLKMFGNGTSECTQNTLASCIGEIKRLDFAEAECNIDYLIEVYSKRKERIERLQNILADIENFIGRNDIDSLYVIIKREDC